MPEVLLINPNYTEALYGKRVLSLHPPLGLAYLASYLREKNIAVEILDANAHNLGEKEVMQKIANSDAKFIGIGATSAIAHIVFAICDKIKKINPSKKIIVGGVHISCLPEESLRKCPAIDYAVIGEGELALFELVNSIKNNSPIKKVNGIAFIDSKDKFVQNNPRAFVIKLDELPFPARELLPNHLYHPGSEFDIGFKGKNYGEIITSRGCPNKCTYCSSAHFWKMLRLRTVDNIFEEVQKLANEGVEHISFLDDTFTISESFILSLCEKITPLGLKWDCYARVENLTDKMVCTMKKAGCLGMRIGFESGSDKILKEIKKNTTLAQARNAMKILKKYDLKTFGFFMIGLPQDTRETIQKTIEFAIELNPTFASFAVTTPFPGTEMFEEYLEKNWISPKVSLHNLTLHEANLTRTNQLSSKEIQRYYSLAKRRFYLRAGYLLSFTKYLLKHPNELKNYIFRVWSKIRNEI